MKKHLLALVVLAAGCSGGPTKEQVRDAFYDELFKRLTLWNGALDTRNTTQQEDWSLQITRLVTPKYEWIATDAISEPNDDRRNLAVWGLAFARQPEAAAVLKRALKDSHPMVRSAAAFGIGRQDPPDPPFDELFAMLDDIRPRLRESALFALKTLLKPGQDQGQLAKFISLVEDPSSEVRNETVQVLGRLRLKPSLPAILKRSLNDSSFLVRLNASLALGLFGSEIAEDATPYLVEMLKDSEAPVVEASWWALKKITGRDFDRLYTTWRDWYDEEQKKWQYVCATHPGVVREIPGACPECGTKLSKQPRPAKAVKLTDQWVCPNHAEVVAPAPGKCAQCKADLVLRKN